MKKNVPVKTFFFCCAASLCVAETFAAGSPIAGMDTVIDAGSMRFSPDEGLQYLSGGVRVSTGGIHLCTDELILNSATNSAEIPSPATLDFENTRFVLLSANYDGAKQELVAKDVCGGRDFLFFDGEKISASREQVGVDGVALYFGEPHWSAISFTTGKMVYDANEDYFHLGASVVRVAGIPVLPIPSLSVMRFDRPPVRVWFNPGSNGTAGTFLRSEIYLTIFEDFEPGVVLDFYERSGLLVSPALAYDTSDSVGEWKAFGTLRSGYINDTANRSDDIYGNEIGGQRGFIDWFHKQELGGMAELSASIHRWSDSEVLRNFRPSLYDENQNPDSYAEFVVPNKDFYFSVFTRFQPNDWQNVQQRLPEIRFDAQPFEIGETGIYQHLSASYAYLRERSSDQYDFFKNNVLTNDGDDAIESSRANFYVGWTRPIHFGDFTSFTPVAGAMVTAYGDTIDGSGNYTRTLGQIGFDADIIFTGTNSYQNETWEINGLRHVFRPIFQYRYIPNSDKGQSHIPAIDREIYLSRPTIIDLAENRVIDELYDEHIFRIGFENLFQTRAKDYGSRDLVEFDIYQDLRKTTRPDDTRTLSDNFIYLKITPANWVNFALNHRMDVYHFSTNSLTTGLTFLDGDVWAFTVGTDHLYKNPYPSAYGESHTRQFYANAWFRLNSYWQAFAELRYDDRENLMTDQVYGVRQRLGNTWEIEYSVRYRKNAGDDDDFSFNLGASLVVF